MSKSKKNKNVQVSISPENYIRRRSRNLPISKCLINTDWDESGLANIFIIRQHANGNFTFCVYLVDKLCLGVKDTLFNFNASPEMLDECIEQMNDMLDMEEISYELAHNIIFAAIEFAEEYGFEPHKDFTATTQYLLKEDTDDVPLIEINCGGEDGKPLYINHGDENPLQVKRIINQLEATAGKGNFNILINTGVNDDDDYYDDDDYDDDYDDDDYDEATYKRYLEKIEAMNDKEIEEESFSVLNEYKKYMIDGDNEDSELLLKTKLLADFWREKDNMINLDLSDEYLKMMESDFSSIKTVESSDVPNSLFPTFMTGGEELEEDFLNSFVEIYEPGAKKRDVEKQIKWFEKKYGNCGALLYLKFIFQINFGNISKDVEKDLKRFSDYFLVKLHHKNTEAQDLSPEETREQFMALVAGKTITRFEMSQFVTYYITHIFDVANSETDNRLEKTDAMLKMFTGDSVDYYDALTKALVIMCHIAQMHATIDEFFERRM